MDFDSISIAIGKDAPWQSLFREHNLNVELIPDKVFSSTNH